MVEPRPDRTSVPDVALLPLQPALAVQLVALDDDHVNDVEPPAETVVGVAVSVTDGAVGWVTVTLIDCVADPPAPVHVNAKAESADSGPVDADPAVTLLPLQLPAAAHAVALVDDHVSVAAEPETTEDGATARVTLGGGGTVGG